MRKTALILVLFLVKVQFGVAQESIHATKLIGEKVFEDEYVVVDFDIVNSFYVFSARRDTVFRVYDSNKKFLGSFGRTGRGPGEIVRPPYFSDSGNLIEENEILISDNQLLTVSVISIEKSLNEGQLVSNKVFELPKALRGIQATETYLVNSETIVGFYDDKLYQQLDDERGFFEYNSTTDSLILVEVQNYTVLPDNLMASININGRLSQINKRRSTVISAHLYNPVIEVIDLSSMIVKKIINGKSNTVKYAFRLIDYERDNLVEYYDSIDLGNDYIYVLFRGEKYTSEKRPCIIEKYTFDGLLVNRYIIDKKYDISKIVVDEERQVLLGRSSSQDSFYEFRM